ncbi:unnamed protein product [Peronospora belbahrii]|uniref:Pectinesterase n=2 Tax=Peronospora belbahrii TaxID=622444 RepID=A0AAU9KZS8_9STRA|nr:unnamed protein product [Peronospora belbahrii]
MRISALSVGVVLASLVAVANARCPELSPHARNSPPSGATVVDQSGKYPGSYQTITEAIDSLSSTSNASIFIFPGLFKERLVVSNKGPLIIQGYTCDILSYSANKVTITHTMSQTTLPTNIIKNRNEATSTMSLKTPSFQLNNLNVVNNAGNTGQALAVYIECDKCSINACSLQGYQDTVCANKGLILFAKTHIVGAVDFIFGKYAVAWFELCDIEAVGPGTITANGRQDARSPSLFVFNKGKVYGNYGKKETYLGRPWSEYSKAVFQFCYLGPIINPEGWLEWNGDPNTENVFFKEFQNTGVGAARDKRVKFSGELTEALKITDYFTSDFRNEWCDKSCL